MLFYYEDHDPSNFIGVILLENSTIRSLTTMLSEQKLLKIVTCSGREVGWRWRRREEATTTTTTPPPLIITTTTTSENLHFLLPSTPPFPYSLPIDHPLCP